MFVALGILLSLVSFCPVVLTIDGPILSNVVPILLAIGLFLTAARIEPAEAQRFLKLTLPFMIGAAVLALWMIIQMLPLPLWQTEPFAKISQLAHPVWTSAAAALGNDMAGSITVDTGATAIALLRYLTFVGILLLSTAVTINRDRAESVLISLTIATSLVASIALVADVFGRGFLAGARAEARVCAALGVSLAAATAWMIFEREAKQKPAPGVKRPKLSWAMLACLTAFAVCVIVILASRSGSLIFATAGGFSTFGAVLLVRRLDLGRWGASAIGVTVLVIGAALVTGAAGTSNDLRLAFVKKDAAALELTQRILADAPLLGDGAGTFDSMRPIYQPPDPGPGDLEAVTTAAKLSIELGRPVLFLIILAAVAGTGLLLRGAAKRRRDFFYPAAAAACLVTMILLAFINVGLLGTVVPLIAGALLGLGLAQSQSQATS
jgi:hypothetical protein